MTMRGARGPSPTVQKKADVAKRPEASHYVGLLVNEPPGLNRAALYLVFRILRSKLIRVRVPRLNLARAVRRVSLG